MEDSRYIGNIYIDKRQTIKYLNKVLTEAIYHGGDGGGAYFSNEDALLESLNELLAYLELKDVCEISKDRYDMIQLTEILPKEKNANQNEENKADEVLSSKVKEDKQKPSFIDDKEKMRDFFLLSKDEFLASYSYLTEEEYNNTKEKVKEERRIRKNKAKER